MHYGILLHNKSFKLNCCFLLIYFIFHFHVDISCRKRVKLTDLGVNIPLSCRRNASSTALEGRQSPRCKFLLLTIHGFCFSGAAYSLGSWYNLLFSFSWSKNVFFSLCAKCLNIYNLYCHNYVVFLVVPIKSNWNSCLKILIIPFECNMQLMTPKLPNLHFLRNWRKMQATNTNPIYYIKKKTSQRSSKLVTVLEVNVQTCISTAIWVFFFFFSLPVLKAGMNLFLLL